MAQSAPAPAAFPAMSIAQANALLTQPGSMLEIEDREIAGRRLKVWKHAPPTLRDVFLSARAFGPRTFLVYEDERTSYEGFARASLAIAHELTARGVKKGDRVAVAMRNVPEWAAAFFGAALTGAVVTPLNAWWTGPELQYGLQDSGAKAVFVDGERLGRLAEHFSSCPELERVYVSRFDEEIGHPWITRLEDVTGPVLKWADLPDAPLPDVPIDPEDDATIFYTSGTTGQPKGALGTHRNFNTNLLNLAFSFARSFLRRGEAPPAPDPNASPKSLLQVVPLFHATGCHSILASAMVQGGKLVLIRKWDPEKAMQLIEREKVTHTGGVPTVAWQLLEHPARERYDLSSLESVAYGGAPSAAELVRRLKQEFPKSAPGNGWGMTELSSTHTHHAGEDYENRPDSCGVPAPVCQVKITGPEGQLLPPGEVGEVWAAGPNVVKGYWNKPEATAETFIDGWVRTGDLGKLDEEGFLFIVDRAKDMLIRGGENIYCVEVENTLYEHPAVMDAAVVAIDHHTLGEEPGAVVTLKPGADATEDELRGFVADRLAAFKVPVRVVFWPEVLPRNPNGKILKADLKKLFEQPAAASTT
jgi:long-chain acyl-CoA synthetase